MRKVQVTVEVADEISSIDDLEDYVNQLGQQIKCQLFTQLAGERINDDLPSEKGLSCPGCKKQSVKIGSRLRRLKTVFGEVKLRVARRKCKNCQRTWSFGAQKLEKLQPAKNSNVTKQLRQIAVLCGTSWPFRQAAEILRQLIGVSLSPAHIQWLCSKEADTAKKQFETKHDQAYWQALVEAVDVMVDYTAEDSDTNSEQQTQEQTPSANRVYIGIDGTFVNATQANRFFEAKAGIVFTDKRIQVSKNRNRLLNKQYVGSCQSVAEFGKKLFCCARDIGIDDSTELIILGDGARWITKLARTQYPLAKLILDWWHLKKRIWETVDWLKSHGLSAKDARQWGKRLRDKLWHGKAKAALQSCMSLGKRLGLSPPGDNPQTQLGETSLQSFYLYLRNNFDSLVDYHTFRQEGYFISSVFVEKTVDLLICRRLKLRGQNWSRNGADNVVTFRQMVHNQLWQSYWQMSNAA